MKNRFCSLLAGGLVLLPMALEAQATLQVQQDSYVVTAPSATVTNYGSAKTMNVGGSTGAVGLVQFDLSPIPPGSLIGSATLTVYVTKLGATGGINETAITARDAVSPSA